MRTDIDLSPEFIAHLKTLAQKATPGPWELTGIPSVTDILSIGACRLIGSPYKIQDAAYIAAAHPSVMLALLSRIEDLEKIVAGSLYGLYAEAHARAERLEKEADWLAENLEYACFNKDDGSGCFTCNQLCPELVNELKMKNRDGIKTCRGATQYGWREAARKAVEEQCKK